MTRFQAYRLLRREDDVFVLLDTLGVQRCVGFKIVDTGLPGHERRFVVWPTSGAWVVLDEAGGFRPLDTLGYGSEAAAVAAFLDFMRDVDVVFDQVDRVDRVGPQARAS